MSHSASRPLKRIRISATLGKPSAPSESSASSAEVLQNAQSDSGDVTSGDSDTDQSNSDEDKEDMLAALEAYNRSMLGMGEVNGRDVARRSAKGKGKAAPSDSEESAQDESTASTRGKLDELGAWSEDSDDEEGGDFYDEDDEFEGIATSDIIADENVPTVVYADTGSSNLPKVSKADYKRFMSSKSAKILANDNPALALDERKRKAQEDGDEEEQSNLSLDKTLHSMLMTNLLPNAQEALRPVDKRNQMSSRLLELANVTGLGEGKSKLAESTHKGHAARMRTAIQQAKVDREEKSRAQAQAAGSWVKGIGGLGDTGAASRGKTLAQQKRGEKSLARKDRDRGLAMGIGKFKGGMLTLNAGEIARGSSSDPSRGRGGKRGGGGGGGGGGGRGKGKRRD